MQLPTIIADLLAIMLIVTSAYLFLDEFRSVKTRADEGMKFIKKLIEKLSH
ncbi:MAG: hypothetical protein WCL14_13580 [Bacteroidota bacterium]